MTDICMNISEKFPPAVRDINLPMKRSTKISIRDKNSQNSCPVSSLSHYIKISIKIVEET